jgi:hypothetical protein
MGKSRVARNISDQVEVGDDLYGRAPVRQPGYVKN